MQLDKARRQSVKRAPFNNFLQFVIMLHLLTYGTKNAGLRKNYKAGLQHCGLTQFCFAQNRHLIVETYFHEHYFILELSILNSTYQQIHI